MFLSLLPVITLLLCPLEARAQGAPDAPPKPPNFIIYLLDDLGYGEPSQQNLSWSFPADPYGVPVPRPFNNSQRTMSSPNLSRFASQGMRAFLSYSPSSECAPSRASLMTGRNVGTLPIRGDSVTASNGLNPNLNEVNIAKVLHDHAGYDTAIIGKWGLGSSTGAPWNQGYNYFYGQLEHKEAWACFPPQLWSVDTSKVNVATASVLSLLSTLQGNVADLAQGMITENNCPLAPTNPCQHTNDMFREQALSFISKHNTAKSTPFFLYWAPTAPHVGFYSEGQLLSSPVKREGNRTGEMTACRRGHASQIEQHIDFDINSLLNLLESSPLLDGNTLVIFSSDNGAHQVTFVVAVFTSLSAKRTNHSKQ